MDELLGQLVHQIEYRCSISLGLPHLAAEDSPRGIIAGLVSATDDTLDPAPEDDALHRAADVDGVWHRWTGGCRTCEPPVAVAVLQGSARPAMTRTAERGGGAMRRCPVVRSAVPPGTPLLVLEGERATNGWLLAGPGWVPPPRVDPSQANAEWRVMYCPNCDKHVARLTALEHLEAETEVVGSSLPAPNLDTILWPYEVTFDGGLGTSTANARFLAPERRSGTILHWEGPPCTLPPPLLLSLTLTTRRLRRPLGAEQPLRPSPTLTRLSEPPGRLGITWQWCATARAQDASSVPFYRRRWSWHWVRWRSEGGRYSGKPFGARPRTD